MSCVTVSLSGSCTPHRAHCGSWNTTCPTCASKLGAEALLAAHGPHRVQCCVANSQRRQEVLVDLHQLPKLVIAASTSNTSKHE